MSAITPNRPRAFAHNLVWDVNTLAWVEMHQPVIEGGSVVIGGVLSTKEVRSATATTSAVSDTGSSTTLLASNASRLGATIANDSSAALYVKLGTTAALTDYTVRVAQYDYYEIPYGYTGRVDGIWASDPNDGAARITELT